jgi:diguanylate cyclase (GGDEF)-like protein
MQMEFEIIGLKGGRRWLETHAVPMQENGETVHLAVTRDITQRKQMQEQVRQLAFHDALTNLPNRRLLLDRLNQARSSSKRNGLYGALIFLDLDNFKPLNDAHGHETGDLLLIEVARRLINCVREIDTVARFGGDEFVVMLSDLNANRQESVLQAQIIAQKIRVALSEIYELTLRHGELPDVTVTHHCTASIGVALFLNHEGSVDDLLNWADAAMYEAKAAGRNTVRFHESGVQESAL